MERRSSVHTDIFKGNDLTQAYINALQRYHNRISFLGHHCAKLLEPLNIREIVKAANDYGLPIEVDCANLYYERTDLKKLDLMLSLVDRVIVNSDAHSLWELKEFRKIGYAYLGI